MPYKGPNRATHRADGTTTIRIRNRKGKVFLCVIDTADYPKVSQYRWCVEIQRRMVYVVRSGHPQVFLNDFIAGRSVDHADFDGLNNRRSNLRAATKVQQATHRRKALHYGNRRSSSMYKGVSWNK